MKRRATVIVVGRGRGAVQVEQRAIPANPSAPRRSTIGLWKAPPVAQPAPPRRAPPASLAEDVERVLRDRVDFPRTLWGELL